VAQLMDCANDVHCTIADDHHEHGQQHEHVEAHAAASTASSLLFPWLLPGPTGHVQPAMKTAAAVLLFLETVVGLVIPPLMKQMRGHLWYVVVCGRCGSACTLAGMQRIIVPARHSLEFANGLLCAVQVAQPSEYLRWRHLLICRCVRVWGCVPQDTCHREFITTA
jgi:hypothetical protein